MSTTDAEEQLASAISQLHLRTSSEPPSKFHFRPSAFGAFSLFKCELQLLREGTVVVQQPLCGEGHEGVGATTRPSQGRLSVESLVNAARGNQFEKHVLQSLGPNVRDFTSHSENGWHKLVELATEMKGSTSLASIVRYVYQCSIMPPQSFLDQLTASWPPNVRSDALPRLELGRCIPDFIRLEHCANNRISLTVVDVKSSAKLKPGHRMQIAYYWLVLRELIRLLDNEQKCVPTTAATPIFLSHMGEVWIPSQTHNRLFDIVEFNAEDCLRFVTDFFGNAVLRVTSAQPQLNLRDIEDGSWYNCGVKWALADSCIGCQHHSSCRSFALRNRLSKCLVLPPGVWAARVVEDELPRTLSQMQALVATRRDLQQQSLLVDSLQALQQERCVFRVPPGIGAQRLPRDTDLIFVAVIADFLHAGFRIAAALTTRIGASSPQPAHTAASVFTDVGEFVAEMMTYQQQGRAHFIVWNAPQRATLQRVLGGALKLEERNLEDFPIGGESPSSSFEARVLQSRVTLLHSLVRDVVCLPVAGTVRFSDLSLLLSDTERPEFSDISFDVFDSVFACGEWDDDQQIPSAEIIVGEIHRAAIRRATELMERAANALHMNAATDAVTCSPISWNPLPPPLSPPPTSSSETTSRTAVIQLLLRALQFKMCSDLTHVLDLRRRSPCIIAYEPLPQRQPTKVLHLFARFIVVDGAAPSRLASEDRDAAWTRTGIADIPQCTKCQKKVHFVMCEQQNLLKVPGEAIGSTSVHIHEQAGPFEAHRWYVFCQCQWDKKSRCLSAQTIEERCAMFPMRGGGGTLIDSLGKQLLTQIGAVPRRGGKEFNDAKWAAAHIMKVGLCSGMALADIIAVEQEEGGQTAVYCSVWKSRVKFESGKKFSMSTRYVEWNAGKAVQTLEMIHAKGCSSIVDLCFRPVVIAPTHDEHSDAQQPPLSHPLPFSSCSPSQGHCVRAFLNSARTTHTSDAAARLVIVQGPPGSGKTHTLAQCLVAAIAASATTLNVLVCAVSHRALTEVAEKTVLVLRSLQPPLICCPCVVVHLNSSKGARVFTHPSGGGKWHPYAVDDNDSFNDVVTPLCTTSTTTSSSASSAATSIDAASCIVICTVWEAFKRGVKPHLRRKKAANPDAIFDAVALDEASQMTLAEAAIPSALTRNRAQQSSSSSSPQRSSPPRFLVTGDFMQLAPILPGELAAAHEAHLPFLFSVMQSLMLRADGSGERLANPSRAVPLMPSQWCDLFVLQESRRSVPAIAQFVSRLYPFGLQSLVDPPQMSPQSLERILPESARAVLCPFFMEPLITLEHVPPDAEAFVISTSVAFLHCINFIRSVVVVTPHRRQKDAVSRQLAAPPSGKTVLVDTTERVQGFEADAAIVALAVEPERDPQFVFNLLRLNVALSRARMKIVVVASDAVLHPPPWIALKDEATAQGCQHLADFAARSAHISYSAFAALGN